MSQLDKNIDRNEILTIGDLNRLSFCFERESDNIEIEYEAGHDWHNQYLRVITCNVCCGLRAKFYFDGREIASVLFNFFDEAKDEARIRDDGYNKWLELPHGEGQWIKTHFNKAIWGIDHVDGSLSLIDILKTAYCHLGDEALRGVGKGKLADFALEDSNPEGGAVLYELGEEGLSADSSTPMKTTLSELVKNTPEEIGTPL